MHDLAESLAIRRARVAGAGPAAEEDRGASRMMAITVALVALFFAVRSILSDVMLWSSGARTAAGFPLVASEDLLARPLIDVFTSAVFVAWVMLMRPERRATPTALLVMVAGAAGAATLKVGVKLVLGMHRLDSTGGVSSAAVEALTVFIAAMFVFIAGFIISGHWRTTHRSERSQLDSRERMVQLLEASQLAELRLRERLSASLHGGVERLFVTVEAQLDHLAATIETDRDLEKRRTRLQGISLELARMRTGELRSLSSMVFPLELGRGVEPSLRAIVAHFPPHVAAELQIHEAGRSFELARPESVQRVLLARIAEVGAARALRHAGVRRVRVCLEYEEEHRCVRVVVEDDGAPNPADTHHPVVEYVRLQAEIYGGGVVIGPGDADSGWGSRLVAEFILPVPTESSTGAAV